MQLEVDMQLMAKYVGALRDIKYTRPGPRGQRQRDRRRRLEAIAVQKKVTRATAMSSAKTHGATVTIKADLPTRPRRKKLAPSHDAGELAEANEPGTR